MSDSEPARAAGFGPRMRNQARMDRLRRHRGDLPQPRPLRLLYDVGGREGDSPARIPDPDRVRRRIPASFRVHLPRRGRRGERRRRPAAPRERSGIKDGRWPMGHGPSARRPGMAMAGSPRRSFTHQPSSNRHDPRRIRRKGSRSALRRWPLPLRGLSSARAGTGRARGPAGRSARTGPRPGRSRPRSSPGG
jgi:hypothetical protein